MMRDSMKSFTSYTNGKGVLLSVKAETPIGIGAFPASDIILLNAKSLKKTGTVLALAKKNEETVPRGLKTVPTPRKP